MDNSDRLMCLRVDIDDLKRVFYSIKTLKSVHPKQCSDLSEIHATFNTQCASDYRIGKLTGQLSFICDDKTSHSEMSCLVIGSSDNFMIFF